MGGVSFVNQAARELAWFLFVPIAACWARRPLAVPSVPCFWAYHCHRALAGPGPQGGRAPETPAQPGLALCNRRVPGKPPVATEFPAKRNGR